jgi:hypothetical protein
MTREGKTSSITRFKAVALPTGTFAYVPLGINVLIPKAPRIAVTDRHYLAYLPWETRFLSHIPAQYQDFFAYVLPFLHARTSNVHTALSVSQLPHLLKDLKSPVDERIIYLSLILHDCGWSQVSTQGLVDSLSYNGVAPTSAASFKPKQQHLVYGEALAYRLLDNYDFGSQPITAEEIYTVSEVIRRHDHDAAWELGKYGPIATEVKLVCDADRLWSYTYENFWLDTVRKDVPPAPYLENLTAEISSYFFTAQGRARARSLIRERKREVEAYQQIIKDPDILAELVLRSRAQPKRILYRARQLALSARSRRVQRGHIRQNSY